MQVRYLAQGLSDDLVVLRLDIAHNAQYEASAWAEEQEPPVDEDPGIGPVCSGSPRPPRRRRGIATARDLRVTIPDDEVKNLKTVGDAVAFIENAQG